MLMAPCTRRLGRLHRIELVMHRRGRAGEIVDLVDLDIERERHVVAQHLEELVVEQVHDIVARAGEVIVDAQHVMPIGQQPLAQMRAEKPSAARDQNPFAETLHEAILFE